jgi:hypothetical protein
MSMLMYQTWAPLLKSAAADVLGFSIVWAASTHVDMPPRTAAHPAR